MTKRNRPPFPRLPAFIVPSLFLCLLHTTTTETEISNPAGPVFPTLLEQTSLCLFFLQDPLSLSLPPLETSPGVPLSLPPPETSPGVPLSLPPPETSPGVVTSHGSSILLKAERTSGSNTEALVTFSICLQGFFHPSNTIKTLWISNPCQLSAEAPFLPLLLQLLQDIVTFAPTAQDSRTRPPQLNLDPAPIARTLGSCPPDELSSFFNLVFLCRLFWLCVHDAPPF